MSAQDSIAEVFDVFLRHNSEDKPAVREIAKRLVKEGVKPWLDEDQIRPGTTWQTALGKQIATIKSAAVFVGASGLGPWQGEEIQAFLNEFIERGLPVIPIILSSVIGTPELPWTLKNRHRVDFRISDPDPVKQLIWGITGEKPTARESLIPETNELSEPRRRYSESRLYPPLAELPDEENRTQLEILRRRVVEYWVDGVLRHSLYKEVLISLGKQQVDEFIDAPWKYAVELSDTLRPATSDRSISATYDAAGLLLILGEPGSGKTTTLLELARTLLEPAEKEIRQRVAVVLNLSSWKKKRPLIEWMSAELSEKYRIPRRIARFWLQYDYLVPLLDGLDEVETSMQPDCVAAINAFIEESNPSGLVVCCRLNEYRWLPDRLKLNGAIRLEPLSEGEVDEYLRRSGVELAALRGAVKADPVLKELAETPLMLNVMSLAYQGVDSNELTTQKEDSPEERRKQIFHLYVEQMFERKGTAFPREKIIGCLSWLAGKMREHSQSVFLVEGLQPSWLGMRANRLTYRFIVALSVGLIGGLRDGLSLGLVILIGVGLGCTSELPLKNWMITGSISGLSLGLIYWTFSGLSDGLVSVPIGGLFVGAIGGLGVGSLNHITLVETLSWKWLQFWKKTVPGSIVGVIGGLSLGPILWLLIGLKLGPSGLIAGLNYGLILGLTFALIFGLIGGLTGGLIGGFTDRVKLGNAIPNQGIKLSGKNSFVVFLATCLIVGPSFALIFELMARLATVVSTQDFSLEVSDATTLGLSLGLMFGLIAGLGRGASTVIKHYALRLILWLTRRTPFNFIKFLDHCAKLILLKKVGGGYIFIHRMLLEYFADLSR